MINNKINVVNKENIEGYLIYKNNLENLESNILIDNELKLAMQEFEISRKK